MIADEASLQRLCVRLASARVVALDTEFHGERSFLPELMLLQLGIDGEPPELVDPLALPDLRPLGAALRGVPLLVHGGDSDVRILAAVAGLEPGPVFDTQVAAGLVGEGWPERLGVLWGRCLGEPLPKTETLSDWSRRPLTEAQVRYAEDDVRVLPALAAHLSERLAELGRRSAFEAIMASRVAAALRPTDPSTAWRSLPGAARAGAEERRVLAALCAWRLGVAESRNLPIGQVLSDGHLQELARRRPDSLEALRTNRRFPSSVLRKDGLALLEVLAGSNSGEVPPPLRPWPAAWAETLRAATPALAPGVAPELIWEEGTLARIHAGGGLEGWRGELLGPQAVAFLEGRSALTLAGRLVDVPSAV